MRGEPLPSGELWHTQTVLRKLLVRLLLPTAKLGICENEELMIDTEQLIDNAWGLIPEGMFDFTPDENRASTFIVEQVTPNHVVVLANMNSQIRIPRTAFLAAVRVLVDNNANQNNPLRIGSSNNLENSLELCMGTKAVCNGTRVINYIGPILLRMGLVAIGHDRPNTIWLI